jgi:hypothetical protein
MWKRVAIAVVLAGGVASAEPTARFGLTFGFDHAAPGPEMGPAVAVGERLGPVVGELEYAWLSFFDGNVVGNGIQRVGLTLRADVLHREPPCRHYACTQAKNLYVEAGADERFGQWVIDSSHITPANSPVPEAHVGFGLELDNRTVPHRDGWQFGVRFEVTPHGATLGSSCRGTDCGSVMPTGSGVDEAVFLEWMFTVGV